MASLSNILTLPLAAGDDPLSHVVDHPLIGNWFSSHMFMLFLTAAIMLLVFPKLTRRYRSGELVPTGTRNFFEALLIYVREDIARPVLAENTNKFIPYLWTLFFFILINNLLGLLPLAQLTGQVFGGHGIGGTATGNIYVTGALAAVSFVVTQVSGIRANGLVNYLKHFTGGAPIYMAPILIPVEIIGMFVKPFALAIRLFANMVAGHVLLAVLIGFVSAAFVSASGEIRWGMGMGVGVVSVIGATAIMCLEVFVAFLQAYLFTFLTSLFIGQLTVHEHEDHDDHAHSHHGKDDMSLGAGDMIDHSLPDNVRQAGSHMAG
ncbi:F0F1 ATP synthase subunit A [Humisphaera borealis]|uniref:ATP synthase subunit a n=1 Tax=Humisphaera borealis TaxID=2807512 RepID=A0A7M2WUE2_9BACT|nr:F0F1 ATP synthase subunit A [Humisphaera borealis]QOV89145.1 F0F1 ATP synthase subunit A [Humisphaera borealis]